MESLLKPMMDFLVNLGVDPDRALMVSGLGLIVKRIRIFLRKYFQCRLGLSFSSQ